VRFASSKGRASFDRLAASTEASMAWAAERILDATPASANAGTQAAESRSARQQKRARAFMAG
jgi:hypothetical protein